MFKIAKRALGAVEPFEYLPSDAQLALGSAATLGRAASRRRPRPPRPPRTW